MRTYMAIKKMLLLLYIALLVAFKNYMYSKRDIKSNQDRCYHYASDPPQIYIYGRARIFHGKWMVLFFMCIFVCCRCSSYQDLRAGNKIDVTMEMNRYIWSMIKINLVWIVSTLLNVKCEFVLCYYFWSLCSIFHMEIRSTYVIVLLSFAIERT